MYIHACMHTYIRTYSRTSVLTTTLGHTCMHTYVRTCILHALRIRTCMHTYVHTYVCTHRHTHLSHVLHIPLHTQKAATGVRVFIIGAGPIGLRLAIDCVMLGAEVVVVEKRRTFSRNNVLHLWPFTIEDLRQLGAKKFYGKFCAGAIDHISEFLCTVNGPPIQWNPNTVEP